MLLEYLGSSLIRRISVTPHHVRDTANNGCERVGSGSSPRLLSVAGLELLFLAPDWIQLLVVGAVGGVALSWILIALKSTMQEYLYKQNHEVTRKSSVNVGTVELQNQYQGLRSLFEEILARTSSDTTYDAEDVAAISQANTRIVNLINETIQINPEEDFAGRIKKKTELLTAIRSYLKHHWNTIPQEAYIPLIQMAAILYTSLRDASYIDNLDEEVYSFYDCKVFSYLYELNKQLESVGFSSYLWGEVRDEKGNVIKAFPMSAEEKAANRVMASENEEIDWIDVDFEGMEELTVEEIEAYLKKRGYS